RTLTAEARHRAPAPPTLSLFMTRVHQAHAVLTSNGPAIHNCNLSGTPRPRSSHPGVLPYVSIAYLSSTLAPAFSSCALTLAASSLLTPSLTGLGAPSTKSLASLSPR